MIDRHETMRDHCLYLAGYHRDDPERAAFYLMQAQLFEELMARREKPVVVDSLSRGADCVVSNTFTRLWEMQPYIDAAKDAGAEVLVLEARGNWANCHGVPMDAIERMRARWEKFEEAQ